MRILYVTFMLQHPRLRGPNRHYHFLRELAHDHAITLLTLTDQPVPPDVMAEIEGYTERMATWPVPVGRTSAASNDPTEGKPTSLGRRSARIARFGAATRAMRRAFDAAIADAGAHDVVLLHGKNLLGVVAGRGRVPLVLDFCDAGSLRIGMRMGCVGWRKRMLLALQRVAVRRMERRAVAATPYLSFISARDRAAILGPGVGAGPADVTAVIPNGVDLAYWRRAPGIAPHPRRLVLSGVMSYAPNDDAARLLVGAILPRIRDMTSDVEVCIAGRDPTPDLVARAAGDPTVMVTGFVDDLRPHLTAATVFVAPLRYASGLQNKVQEAMAMGLPVVTTPVVAEGLRIEDHDPPPVVTSEADPGAFAAAVVDLLNAPERRAALATAGRRYAERHWVWRVSAGQLAALCEAAAVQARPDAPRSGIRTPP